MKKFLIPTIAIILSVAAVGAVSAKGGPDPLKEFSSTGAVVKTWTPIAGTECFSNGTNVLSPTTKAACTPVVATTAAPVTTVAPTTTLAPTTTVAPTTTQAPTTTAATTTTVAPTTTVAIPPTTPIALNASGAQCLEYQYVYQIKGFNQGYTESNYVNFVGSSPFDWENYSPLTIRWSKSNVPVQDLTAVPSDPLPISNYTYYPGVNGGPGSVGWKYISETRYSNTGVTRGTVTC